jgi:hypothetical protein
MKISSSRLILAAAVVAAVALAAPADAQRRASAQLGPNCAGGFQALFDAIEPVPLSAAEEAEVLYLREEEKLARDVYLTLAERWQLPIFSNIARAEQQHMDLVFRLIEVYGLIDPITDDTVGVFSNPDLGILYEQFVIDGADTLVAALTVGATIEDMDLYDLYDLVEFTTNDHITLVAYNLAKGSRNHLRAFVRALLAQGESYTPQSLDQETFDAILAAETERRTFYDADGEPVTACGADVGGFGMRRGAGQGGQSNENGGSGTGTGTCDGTGPNGGGNGGGNGGANGGGNGGGN